MDYNDLKKSMIEIINNDSILKKKLLIQYSINNNDFNNVYNSFIQEFGGEIKKVDFFEIEISDDLIFKYVRND